MGIITINVDEEPISPMTYSGFNVGQQTLCNTSASQKTVKFNNTSGDFIVGYNYYHSQGLPAQTLRILNFTDTAVFINNATNIETPATGFVPKKLKNLTTNMLISTFPYDIPIANLNQLGIDNTGTELICPSDMTNNTARRKRDITFRILDSNGVLGPIQVSQYMNTP